MKSNPDPATLFFDYDGTLHDCIRIYAPAFRKVYREMVAAGHCPTRQFSAPELCRWLGLSVPDMWNSFMPDLAQTLKDHYSTRIGEEMLQLILDSSRRPLSRHREDTGHPPQSWLPNGIPKQLPPLLYGGSPPGFPVGPILFRLFLRGGFPRKCQVGNLSGGP